jgi:serine/threonine protein kinase
MSQKARTSPLSAPLEGLRRLMSPAARTQADDEAPEPVSVQVRSAFGGAGESLPPPRPSQPAPSAPPPDGTPLWSGRIRPGEEVGRGAFGSVLRGLDTKLRRELAIKVTAKPRAELPTALLARFVEEAQITAQLEHPNVVPVHDLGVDPAGRAYFSMKLVRGQSLEAILEKRKSGDPATLSEFGLRRLLDIFLQVCQAVEYAHARGVIHRDLKPANIMVGDFGEVLVMDWGVAKLVGRPEPELPPPLPREVSEGGSIPPGASSGSTVSSIRAENQALATQHGDVLGTPAYMSPEQAQGQNVDERTDVYSLGVILFEILCGEVPFDSDELAVVLARVAGEAPRRPSEIASGTPLSLEMLVMRLLEKDPARRSITIRQIRSHVQDYIDGIGHEYRRESLWTNASWVLGALGLFAFLVWYLTGQSIATVLALTPSTVFNAIGWMLVVMAVGYPLWGATTAFATSGSEHDLFRPPTSEEVFVSGYLAHRTFSVAIAPVFQLVLLASEFIFSLSAAKRAAGSPAAVQALARQFRAEWGHALIAVVVFLFAYLFLLSTEVRFARRLDRYVPLVYRRRWEGLWPMLFTSVVVLTIITTDVVEWTSPGYGADGWAFFHEQVLTSRLEPFEIIKTLVFQGTFLLGLVATAVLLAFPFGEVLASLRMAHQRADEASVGGRREYFLRSLAVFQIAKANWLYGGTMIAGLTAVTVLSDGSASPLVERVLYILGPALIGLAGYVWTTRWSKARLAAAPAVQRMIAEAIRAAQSENASAIVEQIGSVSWRRRLGQVALPLACLVGYLVWNGSGVHQQAIRELIMPVSAGGFVLILPYALLLPMLLVRDSLQLRFLRSHATASIPGSDEIVS